jgi:hypothetical protein
MTVVTGDFISIPAGTTIYKVIRRVTRVEGVPSEKSYTLSKVKKFKVHLIFDVREQSPYSLLNDEATEATKVADFFFDERKAISIAKKQNPNPIWAVKLPPHDTWDGTDYVLIDDVKKTDAPKAAATKTMSFVQKCVKGSQWKLLVDTIYYKDDVLNNWWNCREIGVLPAGTIITIAGKKANQTYKTSAEDPHPESSLFKYKYVLSAPFKTDSSNEIFWFRIEGIKNSIEELDVPKVLVYKLRDKNTGLFFSGTDWSEDFKKANDAYHAEYEKQRANAKDIDDILKIQIPRPPVETIPTYSKTGKTYKNLSGLKSAIRILAGLTKYDESLPYDAAGPEWLEYGSTIDIPDSWEIVEFEKFSKTETVIDFNIIEYIARSKKLKVLSGTYGYAVKDLFSKLEENNQLLDYKGMIVFTQPLDTNGESVSIPKTEVERIKELAKDYGNNGFQLLHKNVSVAVAYANTDIALLLKLAYDGPAKVTVINTSNLIEVFEK